MELISSEKERVDGERMTWLCLVLFFCVYNGPGFQIMKREAV